MDAKRDLKDLPTKQEERSNNKASRPHDEGCDAPSIIAVVTIATILNHHDFHHSTVMRVWCDCTKGDASLCPHSMGHSEALQTMVLPTTAPMVKSLGSH